MENQDVRPNSHEGSWYPREVDVSQYLETGAVDDTIRAVIVPHAGYKYCGDVLGKVYSQIGDNYHTVVILGTCHVGVSWCK